ncbi:hypothetical protein M413DRAFT_276112 [Hebeloma cylindrosporum]|uniref:Uncharacterized protein n=1 Tax=Hebeloma cylindrosporum TaxID=76867 RepID=A0A0C3BKL7_HEBCY|nr:hypothetical protein M413DRAFT_276112 [Hebeloma cylindrosporum h7]
MCPPSARLCPITRFPHLTDTHSSSHRLSFRIFQGESSSPTFFTAFPTTVFFLSFSSSSSSLFRGTFPKTPNNGSSCGWIKTKLNQGSNIIHCYLCPHPSSASWFTSLYLLSLSSFVLVAVLLHEIRKCCPAVPPCIYLYSSPLSRL